MKEIWISETLIGVFLLLALIRPLIRKLWPLEGLTWLPVAALFFSICLFPAYGMRPEVIPLLAFSGIVSIFHYPALITSIFRRRQEDFSKSGLFFTIPALILLVLCLAVALRFSPLGDTGLSQNYALTITLKNDYFLRIYREGEEKEPLLILAPPVNGSVRAVDRLCTELAKRGLTVLTWSRRGLDTPAINGEGKIFHRGIKNRLRLFRLMKSGRRLVKANAAGRDLEEQRKQDILLMLSWIRENRRSGTLPWESAGGEKAGPEILFLAGYAEGGSALAALAASPDFIRDNPGIRGLILIESPFWSSYEGEKPREEALPESPLGRLRLMVSRRLNALKPEKIAGIAEVPEPGYPLLILVSDSALESPMRQDRYYPLFQMIQNTRVPLVLAAVDGAGPLDYSDYPEKFPLLSALNPGKKKPAWSDADFVPGTASLMANFAALLANPEAPPALFPLPGPVHTETRGWNLPSPGYILPR
jgi:hypothetical protein